MQRVNLSFYFNFYTLYNFSTNLIFCLHWFLQFAMFTSLVFASYFFSITQFKRETLN